MPNLFSFCVKTVEIRFRYWISPRLWTSDCDHRLELATSIQLMVAMWTWLWSWFIFGVQTEITSTLNVCYYETLSERKRQMKSLDLHLNLKCHIKINTISYQNGSPRFVFSLVIYILNRVLRFWTAKIPLILQLTCQSKLKCNTTFSAPNRKILELFYRYLTRSQHTPFER